MCGIADLVYFSNKNRYTKYKIKIMELKAKRLKSLMYETDPGQYQRDFGFDITVQNALIKRSFLSKLFRKEPSEAEKAQARITMITQLAETVNTTYSFEEFISSYDKIIKNLEFLKSIEHLSFFTGTKPSEDLTMIKEKRPLTEKEFIDRYFYQYGKENLASKKIYFDRFLPETVKYIRTLSGESISEPEINNNFDYMEGHDFEYFCADILKKNGFSDVEVTQGSGDHGVDILAQKDDISYAIQCKCYSSNIGNSAVQQAHTGKSIYHKDIAVVLTNRYFTPQAKQEAQVLGVKLWDRDKLKEMIEK